MSCPRNLIEDNAERDTGTIKQEPIPGVRLQRVPDFVSFTHERHLRTGLRCADCYDSVERVPRGTVAEFAMVLLPSGGIP